MDEVEGHGQVEGQRQILKIHRDVEADIGRGGGGGAAQGTKMEGVYSLKATRWRGKGQVGRSVGRSVSFFFFSSREKKAKPDMMR